MDQSNGVPVEPNLQAPHQIDLPLTSEPCQEKKPEIEPGYGCNWT